MAGIEVPARDMLFEVEGATPNTWLEPDGVNSFSLNPTEGEEFTDVTKFKDKGNPRRRKMQRGDAITLEGEVMRDPVTGALDPGQARLVYLNKQLGEDGVFRIRFRHPLESTWEVWNATLSLGESSGGNNDMLTFPITVVRDGAATSMAVS